MILVRQNTMQMYSNTVGREQTTENKPTMVKLTNQRLLQQAKETVQPYVPGRRLYHNDIIQIALQLVVSKYKDYARELSQ